MLLKNNLQIINARDKAIYIGQPINRNILLCSTLLNKMKIASKTNGRILLVWFFCR